MQTQHLHEREQASVRTYPRDEVVLQVEDSQVTAPPVQVLEPLDVLLVERELLEREDLTVVVFRAPAYHVLGD